MTSISLLRLWVVAPVAFLASCDGRPPSSPTPRAPAYHRWVALSGFAVTDLEGNWACVAKDDRGQPTHIVAGLVVTSGGERYPTLPRALFATQFEVPLDQWVSISVPARSSHPLLLVTTEGYTESLPPRPLAEMADALWNLEAKHDSVRRVVAEKK